MQLKELTHDVLNAFMKKNQKKMKKANSRIAEELMASFSEELFRLAVISYSLYKIMSKPRFYRKQYGQGMERIGQILGYMERKAGRKKEYLVAADNFRETILEMESEDPRFVKSLIDKGKLKTAVVLYAQGMSLSLASELTRIPKQDIMDYTGKTMMADRVEEAIGISERIKNAKRIFGG
jgi:hypothetical protein